MESGSAGDGIAVMRAGWDTVRAGVEAMSPLEILETMDQLEELTRQMPTLRHQMLARLHREASPVELGAKNLRAVLTGRLGISSTEAGRRLDEAAELGPRVGVSGAPMAPVLAVTAAAQAAGIIGPEHVTIIRTTCKKLPGWVDPTTASPTTAGPSASSEASPNGSHRRNSTPAKPAPTTTTTPNAS